MKNRLIAAIAALGVALAAAVAAPAIAATSLTGAGSSYANKFIVGCDAKSSEFTITYNPAGSGTGRSQFAAGTVDFGASDSASSVLTLTGSRAGGQYTYIPVVGGPIAIMYNIKGIKTGELRFTPAVVANIFNGTIQKWNDKRIKKLQLPAVAKKLPNKAIQVVYRGSSSGTSENFTNYLNQTAPKNWAFTKNSLIYGTGSASAPAGAVSATNSAEMLSNVKAVANRIGYADLSDAVSSTGKALASVAQIKNANGEWVLPSSEAASKFLETFYEDEFNAKTGEVKLAYTKKVKGAYNLSLLTYFIADKNSSSAVDKDVEAFATYLLKTCGPTTAKTLGYSPISGNLKTAALALVANITK